MRHRARHVYWLNPEPRSYWDTGDSIVSEYGIHCDGVFECRNLRQLERLRRQPRLMSRLVLIRHGESWATVDRMVVGHDCRGLTPRGRQPGRGAP